MQWAHPPYPPHMGDSNCHRKLHLILLSQSTHGELQRSLNPFLPGHLSQQPTPHLCYCFSFSSISLRPPISLMESDVPHRCSRRTCALRSCSSRRGVAHPISQSDPQQHALAPPIPLHCLGWVVRVGCLPPESSLVLVSWLPQNRFRSFGIVLMVYLQ